MLIFVRVTLVCATLASSGYGAIRWANEFGNAFHRTDFQNIQFKLNQSTVSAIQGDPTSAVQAALNSWNSLPNTALHFAPLAGTTAGIAADGQNVIAFADTADAKAQVGNFPAVTVPHYSPDGSVSETDIILNPAFQFSTTLQANTADLQSVIAHELGHALGANHSTVTSATMFWNTLLQDNSKAQLKADDAAFAADAYPSAGAGQNYGVLSGTASKDGAALLGAAIIATDPSSGIAIGSISSVTDGSFSFKVPAGNYLLFAEPITPLTPVTAMYQVPSSQPGQQQAKIDTSFKPAMASAMTIRVDGGSTASASIAAVGGNSALVIAAEGSVASSGSYFIGPPPVLVQSGQALDYLVSGPGLDSSITQQNLQLIGPGVTIRPGTFHVENGAKDLNGLSPLRFTIDIAPRSTAASVSLFIVRGTDTALLPGGIAILPVKPSFTANSLVDAASFKGAGVAPGELISLFGSNVAPNPPLSNSGFDPATGALPTTLAGVSITFDGIPAPLIFTSSGQINLQVPYEVSGRAGTVVVVTNQGAASSPVTVPVVSVQPGIFMLSGSQAAALNQDGSVNGASNPAPKGSYVVLYATGAGLVNPAVPTGKPAPSSPLSFAPSVSVSIGGANAVIYQGGVLAPGFVGLLQVAVQVPQSAPSGNVPVTLSIAGQTSPGGTTIAVQ